MNQPDSKQPTIVTTRFPGWGLHAVALFAAVLTWPLLISGGQVTTYKVGMAVPDWPSTFNENMFLYDFWDSPLGVFIEHRHRLFGSALGFTAIVLAIWSLVADPRRWMKVAGFGALLAVIGQGLIGGLRVLQNSTAWAAFHACSGQAVFALLVAIAVWTGPRWWNRTSTKRDVNHLRLVSAITLALIYFQIVMGAWVRHFASPISASVHVLTALCVLGSMAWLIRQVEWNRHSVPFLVPSARTMAVILVIQMALGLAALWILLPFDGSASTVSPIQALIRTGHQANGALLLASSVVLSLRAFRNLQANPQASRHAVETTGKRSELEAVF